MRAEEEEAAVLLPASGKHMGAEWAVTPGQDTVISKGDGLLSNWASAVHWLWSTYTSLATSWHLKVRIPLSL